MTPVLFSDPAAWQRLHVGPLSPYLDAFAQDLLDQGYTPCTVSSKLRVAAKLSRWLAHHRLGVAALAEQPIERFLHELHQRERRTHHGEPTTLRVLLEQLRRSGILPAPVPPGDESERARLEQAFARYLREERGLSAATVRLYLPVVRHFLAVRFGHNPLELARLCAREVTRFVLHHVPRLKPMRAKLMVTALRSFCRFLQQRGQLGTDLAAAVPAVADWRLATLPQDLEPAQVERLLKSGALSPAGGQRDHSVLLLLARRGLRAGEVVHLCLADIDWPAGVLSVRGKGGRAARLPLPVEVGQALATSLRSGRPGCATRRVFVRLRAPRLGFASSVAIDSIMRRVLKRATLEPAHKGAPLRRHSLATRMLRQGAALTEMGQLLRHRLPQTTEIYAKVDQTALSALAHPWPGGEP
jgi:site-specific recombinase XerD